MARLAVLQNFYVSKTWRNFRTYLIIKRGCKCSVCSKVFADTSKLVAHHKLELTADNITNPAITLNEDVIAVDCIDCHNKESNRFSTKTHDVYIIYGSPCSGKNTALLDMMRRGDLIMDIDRLWEAVTLCPRYDKPNNVRFNVFALKNLIIDNIKTRFGSWNNAYIIGGYPEKAEREALATELGATLIYCESTKEECITRLMADASRVSVRSEWERYISDWWGHYRA